MKKIKFPLLLRVVVAIVLGIALSGLLTEGWVRAFATFNALFAALLDFLIPLIIMGLVAPAIAEIGGAAGRILAVTVVLAYVDTVVAGLLGYGVGEALFPSMLNTSAGAVEAEHTTLAPFFTLSIPPMLDVMSALVFSFIVGLGIAYGPKDSALGRVFGEFRTVIEGVIAKVIIPLLPLYIFGIFLGMAFSGEALRIVVVFAQIIVVIFVLHVVILLYEFAIAGLLARRNPLRMLWTMLPAYFTALGTSSSAATIPVTLRQTLRNGVSEGIAGFVVPLCATIHLSGSMMKITCCALTICMLSGLPHDFGFFLHFMLVLAVIMVAAPGVPGGAVMAALAPLSSILGFTAEQQALMIALYIAMDSFGTACNVTGDGAIAVVVDKMFNKEQVTRSK